MPETIDTIENFHQALAEIKKGDFRLSDGQNPVMISGILGEGGSKTVYDVKIGEDDIALALPNITDNTVIAERKWNNVLQEPDKTTAVRESGLRTNTVCSTKTIEINGVAFPALIMTRYQDLPFEVRDSKNRRSSILKTRMIPEEGVTIDQLLSLFGGISADIESLVRNGIHLGKDSFSISVDGEGVRLYLNDLGNSKIEPFSKKDIPNVCDAYVRYAVIAFIESLSDEEYDGSKELLSEISGLKNNFEKKLTARILANIGDQS
jgi:hypothetical protein